MTWFFRDPERPVGDGSIIAAADGVVQEIRQVADGRWRIATFMSVLDVHVNRSPVAGVVQSVTRRAGGYVPAFEKESERNERLVWHIQSAVGDVEVVQIAGATARRIVPYLGVGDRVSQGQRMGMIRFGSRVDVYLPRGIAPRVAIGERMTAGWTSLA
jgi:phosphatidylserine decarboxylase